MIKIYNLADKPEFIETVVKWIYEEWGKNNFNYWNSWVRSSLLKDDVPQTLIALVDGELAGTASLWRCDLQSRQDLFPWFGGLYVSIEFRGKEFNGEKIGSALIKYSIDVLKSLSFKKAYLFTEKETSYYERFGWKPIGFGYSEGDEQVNLCEINL